MPHLRKPLILLDFSACLLFLNLISTVFLRFSNIFYARFWTGGKPEKRWEYNREMYRSGRNEADSKSVVPLGTGGSNPSISAIGLQWFATAGFFFCSCRLSFRCADEHSAHCICGFFLCGEVQMRINICRGCEGAVSQPDLNLLHGDSVTEKQAGAGVPLRYNYDKPEKPRISRVFGYQARFFILFQPEKSSREVVIS